MSNGTDWIEAEGDGFIDKHEDGSELRGFQAVRPDPSSRGMEIGLSIDFFALAEEDEEDDCEGEDDANLPH